MSNAKKKVTVPKLVKSVKMAAPVAAKKKTVKSPAVKKGTEKAKAPVKAVATPRASLAKTIIEKLFASPATKVSKPAPTKKVLLQPPTPSKTKSKAKVLVAPKQVAPISPTKSSGKVPVKFIKVYR